MDYHDADWFTVTETSEYSRHVQRLLTPAEQDALISPLATNPLAGDLIQGTGGIRKL